MRKIIYTILLCLICSITFGQTYENTGTANLQRAPTSQGYIYRNNMASKGYVYWYTKGQIDSVALNRLPTGLQGQIIRNVTDNSKQYAAYDPLVYGNFVYTGTQLTNALAAGAQSQLQIFNSFRRFAHGGNPSNPSTTLINGQMPVRADQTNSWSYDTIANAFKSTFNTGSYIGVFSPDKYLVYVHDVTLSSTAADNDRIGIVIAFAEDSAQLVVNRAYGLDTADFNWSINVTDSLIPRQHTLTVFRSRIDPSNTYEVRYDYLLPTAKLVANGSSSGVYNTTANWAGVTVDIEVKRSGDTVLIKTSDFSDAPGGKGSLRFPITINLSSDTALYKFRGAKAYGYSAQSQALASYSNIYFSGSSNIIYDLRNGNTYPFTGTGYVIDPAKNMYRDLGVRFLWRNPIIHSFGYILPGNTYDVIVEAH